MSNVSDSAGAQTLMSGSGIIGDVILNQAEALWPAACFEASAWLRDG